MCPRHWRHVPRPWRRKLWRRGLVMSALALLGDAVDKSKKSVADMEAEWGKRRSMPELDIPTPVIFLASQNREVALVVRSFPSGVPVLDGYVCEIGQPVHYRVPTAAEMMEWVVRCPRH